MPPMRTALFTMHTPPCALLGSMNLSVHRSSSTVQLSKCTSPPTCLQSSTNSIQMSWQGLSCTMHITFVTMNAMLLGPAHIARSCRAWMMLQCMHIALQHCATHTSQA